MIKNIIFDWSGVINDSVNNHLFIVNEIFKKFNIKEINLNELRENWEQPYMFFYNKYLPNLTLNDEQIAYKQAVKKCPENNPFPGMVDLLKKFKREGIKMAILSSDFQETILSEIKSFGLDNLFVDIVTGMHDKNKSLIAMLKRNNFDKKETVFVGDSNHEIEVGKNVGIKTASVTWGFSPEKKLSNLNPDFIIHNLSELKSLILKN